MFTDNPYLSTELWPLIKFDTNHFWLHINSKQHKQLRYTLPVYSYDTEHSTWDARWTVMRW